MTPDLSPRLRKAGLPKDAVLAVRGNLLDADVLRADASLVSERYPTWELTGVSSFHARNSQEVAVLCETKLDRFAVVFTFRRADLESAGVQILATYRTPHVTLAAASADRLIDMLENCPHERLQNPYHEPEGQEDQA
jgi:hypothetical protein